MKTKINNLKIYNNFLLKNTLTLYARPIVWGLTTSTFATMIIRNDKREIPFFLAEVVVAGILESIKMGHENKKMDLRYQLSETNIDFKIEDEREEDHKSINPMPFSVGLVSGLLPMFDSNALNVVMGLSMTGLSVSLLKDLINKNNELSNNYKDKIESLNEKAANKLNKILTKRY